MIVTVVVLTLSHGFYLPRSRDYYVRMPAPPTQGLGRETNAHAHNVKSDVYSYGVLLVEMGYGEASKIQEGMEYLRQSWSDLASLASQCMRHPHYEGDHSKYTPQYGTVTDRVLCTCMLSSAMTFYYCFVPLLGCFYFYRVLINN